MKKVFIVFPVHILILMLGSIGFSVPSFAGQGEVLSSVICFEIDGYTTSEDNTKGLQNDKGMLRQRQKPGIKIESVGHLEKCLDSSFLNTNPYLPFVDSLEE